MSTKQQNTVRSVSEQAYSLIRNMIETMSRQGVLQLPPEPELAKDLNVSRVTVRRVLSRLQTERLIDRQKGRGTFIRQNSQQKRFSILYLSHADLFESWISGILRGVTREAKSIGIGVNFKAVPLWGQEGLVDQLISEVRTGLVDGYIILLQLHLKDCLRLREANIPVVWIAQDYGRDDLPAVLADHRKLTPVMVSHLKGKKCHQLALISGPMGTETIRMADMITTSLKSSLPANMRFPTTNHIATERTVEEGRVAMRQLLNRKVVPDAIITTDDDLAVGALLALKEKGVNDQQRPEIISYVTPTSNLRELLPWTVIEMPHPEQIGIKGVEMLKTLMDGETLDPLITYLSPTL